MDSVFERAFVLSETPDYEPDVGESIAARAASIGIDRWEFALDVLSSDDGETLLLHPFENYHAGNLDVVREMLLSDTTISGLGDAGAHVATTCDASACTFLLTHWVRDRARGERLPLPFVVHKHTQATAAAYGLLDRGVIAPGYKADLNVVDFEGLSCSAPRVVHDLPAGGRRLVQDARGYRSTWVSGVEVGRDGEATGELPGRLLRGATPRPSAP
jgi:N-acyl-D-aspartate/D-glutamate deacylase